MEGRAPCPAGQSAARETGLSTALTGLVTEGPAGPARMLPTPHTGLCVQGGDTKRALASNNRFSSQLMKTGFVSSLPASGRAANKGGLGVLESGTGEAPSGPDPESGGPQQQDGHTDSICLWDHENPHTALSLKPPLGTALRKALGSQARPEGDGISVAWPLTDRGLQGCADGPMLSFSLQSPSLRTGVSPVLLCGPLPALLPSLL